MTGHVIFDGLPGTLRPPTDRFERCDLVRDRRLFAATRRKSLCKIKLLKYVSATLRIKNVQAENDIVFGIACGPVELDIENVLSDDIRLEEVDILPNLTLIVGALQVNGQFPTMYHRGHCPRGKDPTLARQQGDVTRIDLPPLSCIDLSPASRHDRFKINTVLSLPICLNQSLSLTFIAVQVAGTCSSNECL